MPVHAIQKFFTRLPRILPHNLGFHKAVLFLFLYDQPDPEAARKHKNRHEPASQKLCPYRIAIHAALQHEQAVHIPAEKDHQQYRRDVFNRNMEPLCRHPIACRIAVDLLDDLVRVKTPANGDALQHTD